MIKKTLILLSFVFVAVMCSAQVKIDYSDLDDETSETDVKPALMPSHEYIEFLPAPLIIKEDTVKEEKTVLRYGFVDLAYIKSANPQLAKMEKDLLNRIKLMEYQWKEIESSYSQAEKEKLKSELEDANEEHNQLISNVWNYCIEPAMKLGYIPLNINIKEYATGTGVDDIPDITWEVSKELNKSPIMPYREAQLNEGNLKIAYINLAALYSKFEPVTSSVQPLINYLYAKDNSYGESFINQFNKICSELAERIDENAKSKSATLGYDVVLLIHLEGMSPVVLANMEDITYPVLQHCISVVDYNGVLKQIDDLCNEYSKLYVR